jgi:hypothetical protein
MIGGVFRLAGTRRLRRRRQTPAAASPATRIERAAAALRHVPVLALVVGADVPPGAERLARAPPRARSTEALGSWSDAGRSRAFVPDASTAPRDADRDASSGRARSQPVSDGGTRLRSGASARVREAAVTLDATAAPCECAAATVAPEVSPAALPAAVAAVDVTGSTSATGVAGAASASLAPGSLASAAATGSGALVASEPGAGAACGSGSGCGVGCGCGWGVGCGWEAGCGWGVGCGCGAGCGAGGSGGGGGPARLGRNSIGSTYPCGSADSRIPRWTYGVSCSASPLGPMVPTTAPSSTFAPLVAAIPPRWTSVTEYPSAVSIVTTLPLAPTVPANAIRPAAGATTSAPAPSATSMPRCWPAA